MIKEFYLPEFGEYSRYAVDFISLKHGLRDVAQIDLTDEDDYGKLKDFASRFKWKVAKSNFKFDLENLKKGKFMKIPISSDKKGLFHCYIFNPLKININSAINDDVLGQLMGYPDCCIRNYINKKNEIRNLILNYKMNVLEISTEAIDLANEYIKNGAIPKSEPEDAYHIAIATINNIETLASWNFKHIVSINPIRKIHEVNKKFNYPFIEIGSLELFGGSKYGNL